MHAQPRALPAGTPRTETHPAEPSRGLLSASRPARVLHQSRGRDCMSAPLNLSPRHLLLLHERAISDAVASERGCYTEPNPPSLSVLGFKPGQRGVGMVLPLFSVRGAVEGHLLRRDEPRSNKQGKPIKYEAPAGGHMLID